MLRTIIIEPINKAMNMQTLPLGFWYKGVFKTLTPDYEVLDWRGNPNDKDVPSMTVWKFSHIKMQETIQFEDDPNKQNSVDKRKMNAVNTFFGLHPFVLHGETESSPNWNPNAKDHQYRIVDATEQGMDHIISFEDRLNITNKVYNMDISEKRNVCFYFAQNPVGKTDKEVNLFLCDPATGYLFTDNTNETQKQKIETFKKTFMNDDPEREFFINIQKAIILNVLENRADNGKNNYYLGATPIGQNVTDVAMYFKKEGDLYQKHIIEQIKDKEDIKDEKKKSVNQMTSMISSGSNDSASSAKVKEEYKLRAKRLKDEGYIAIDFKWHLVSVDKLKAEVEAAEQRKAEKTMA